MGNQVITFTEQQLENYQDCTFFTRKEILRVFKRFRDMCPDIVPKQMTHDEPRTIGIPTRYVEQLPELRENPFRRRICEVFTDDGIRDLTFEDFLDMLSVFSEQAPRNIKVYYAFKIYGRFAPNMEDYFRFVTSKLRFLLSIEDRFQTRPSDVNKENGNYYVFHTAVLDRTCIEKVTRSSAHTGLGTRRPEHGASSLIYITTLTLYFDGDDYIGVRDLEEATKLLTRNELNAEEIAQVAEKVIEEADVDGDGKLSYMEFEQVILRAPDFISTFHIRI
ncbi:unnamed protein product [Bemisia tabaci]|uniref:EF-hand domain-containing protein n=1 Tax=Bemisia tabaci TaxID=7038 RepID=A0A9P0F6U8_BEMTA|nr:unnamed protein product [Bemisia tabaci]